jgi:hypothetical protein
MNATARSVVIPLVTGVLGAVVGLTVGRRRPEGGNDTPLVSATVASGERGASHSEAAVESYARANSTLVEQAAATERKLRELTVARDGLEREIVALRAKLTEGDAGARGNRNPFDLGASDWAELAKVGTIKYRTPCFQADPWSPPPETLSALGLSTDDAATIRDAYDRSNTRLARSILPLCEQFTGSRDIAEHIGVNTCIHLINDLTHEKDDAAANEAMRQVGEVRSGERDAPAIDQQGPLMKMFLALTDEPRLFEEDMARSFGPDEAHRLAFSDGMCSNNSEFGGAGPRQ